MTGKPSTPELGAELDNLRAQLAEAEAVLRAIRNGEVDAVVVTGQHGEQVHTLTEQRLHKQIVAAERLAHLILEQAAEAIVVCDEQGRVIRASQTARQFCNGSPLRRPFAEVFPLQTAASAPFHLAPVLQGEPLRNVDVALDRQGQKFDLILNAGPLLNGGQVLGCVLSLTNVTERKRSEQMLRASEEQFRGIFEMASVGIAQADVRTGQWLRVNPKMCEITGYSADELLQMRVPGITHPEDRQKDWDAFQRVVRGEAPDYRLEKRYVRKDGSPAWVNVNMTVLRDAAHLPTRTIATIEDITERKRAEASQARLAMAVEHASETVVITDENGAILYANPAFEKTSGYTRAEALGQNPRLLKSGKHDADFYRQMWAMLAAGQNWSGHLINKRKDGSLYEEDANISPVFDAARKIVNYVAVKRDVTEQRKQEAQMRRTQRLESIGTLASGVAHDLNNALAPILMAAELLRLEFPDTAAEYLELIQAGARRGADMVKQLLTFAKGAEGERLLIQPRHLLKEIEKLMRGTFPKNIQLQTNYAKDLRTVLGDATQLHQVLLNLCVNARDAMPKGGTLTLKAENIEMDAVAASAVPQAKPGEYVVWRVTDTGDGIPPEILDRIFEPFFTTKGPDKGTGLGLSTVIGIVKSHGGFVRVYSTPGQGSTFAVYLPAYGADATDTSLLAKVETTFRGNGETVLVVDDEPSVREVLRKVLTTLNFKVLTAANGTEALLQVAEKRARLRLVITDLHMPQMDGLAFVRVLKGSLPRAGIIVVSGRMDEREENEFKALGVSTLLDKPFTQEKLVTALKTVLQKSAL